MRTKKELLNQAIVLYNDLSRLYKCPYPDKDNNNNFIEDQFNFFISNEKSNNIETIEKLLRLNSCEKYLALLHLIIAFQEGFTWDFIRNKMQELVKHNPGDIKSKLHAIITDKFWLKEYKVTFTPRRYIGS